MTDAQKNFTAADMAHRVASSALYTAAKRYRAREIGDDEYLAARKAHTEALAAYDAAEAAL